MNRSHQRTKLERTELCHSLLARTKRTFASCHWMAPVNLAARSYVKIQQMVEAGFRAPSIYDWTLCPTTLFGSLSWLGFFDARRRWFYSFPPKPKPQEGKMPPLFHKSIYIFSSIAQRSLSLESGHVLRRHLMSNFSKRARRKHTFQDVARVFRGFGKGFQALAGDSAKGRNQHSKGLSRIRKLEKTCVILPSPLLSWQKQGTVSTAPADRQTTTNGDGAKQRRRFFLWFLLVRSSKRNSRLFVVIGFHHLVLQLECLLLLLRATS